MYRRTYEYVYLLENSIAMQQVSSIEVTLELELQ